MKKLPVFATVLLTATILQANPVQPKIMESGNWIVKLGDVVSLTQGGFEVARWRLDQWAFDEWMPVDTNGYEAVAHPFSDTTKNAIKVIVEIVDGHLRVKVSCLDDGVKCPQFLMPMDKSLVGSVVEMDGKGYSISPGKPEKTEFPNATSFDLFRNEPLKRFRIDVKTCRFANLRDFRAQREESPFLLFVIPKDNKSIELDFDLTLSDAPQGLAASIGVKSGVDPVLPRPASGRNYIENPSFEGGLALWGLTPGTPTFPDPTERCGWRLVEGQARSGRFCAEYTSVKGCNAPMLCPYPVAVTPGRDYTVSFYAKTDTPGAQIRIRAQGAIWGVFPCSQRVQLGKDWQRYVFTFKAPSPFVLFAFGDGTSETGRRELAKVLLDDVQFEKGAMTNDFVQKPFFARFETVAPGGVYFTGEAAPVKLIVSNVTDQEAKVSAWVKVLDVNGKLLDSKPQEFTISANSEASTTLDIEKECRKGLFRLVAEVKSGEFSDVFFGRVTLCDDLSGRPLSVKYLCHREVGPSLDEVAWLKRIGYRGSLSFILPESPAIYGEYERAGWKHIFGVTEGTEAPVKVFEQQMTEADWAKYFDWIDARQKPFAGLPVWYKTMNEPDIPRRAVWTPADHVRIVKHLHDVIKPSSPSSLILTPDPYHSGREAQSWIDQFLAAGGKDVVDALAIHTYGGRAESPDLDANIQALKAIKAKHGLSKIPILFTEGEGIPLYTIDAIGMSPLKGFFEWRLGLLSLDVGPSEVTAAAAMVRRLLVAMKNADDVKSYLTWSEDFNEYDHQPKASLGAINNVFSLLGDATFACEQVIGVNVRTYVFTTPQGGPVAVLWCHDLKVERGEIPAPKASLPLPASGWRLLDLMGNPLEYSRTNGVVEFPLGNQPVYIVCDTVPLAVLNTSLERSRVGGGGLETVDMSLRLISAGEATIQIKNKLTREVSGTLVASIDGKPVLTKEMVLKTKEARTATLALPARHDVLNCAQISLTFKDSATEALSRYEDSFRWFAVKPMSTEPTFTGNLSDWTEASQIRLDTSASVVNSLAPWEGARDCSATWHFGYSSDGLYICAEVRDESFVIEKTVKNAWLGDSLQLYFDLLADGHDNPGLGYDSNDETVWAAKIDGKDTLYRDYTPEWQVAFVKGGVINDAKIAVTRKGNVTIYEIKLPPTETSPLAMKPGTSFGCGLIVNDADAEGVRKQALTNTKPGTEPHSHPELWPHAVLTDK